jgi:hypothetical protein
VCREYLIPFKETAMSMPSNAPSTASPAEGITFSLDHTDGGMFRLAFRKTNGDAILSIDLPVVQLAQIQTTIAVRMAEFLQALATQVAAAQQPARK